MRPSAISLLSLALLTPAVLSHPSNTNRSSDPSSWRKFTASVVSRVWPSWGSDKSYSHSDAAAQSNARSARYLNDVVLRFNLTTPDQAWAIKEAAEDLYLDIWEHTDDWVDIRVAKDIVCITRIYCQFKKLTFATHRSHRCSIFFQSLSVPPMRL
jgi:extracellular matrix protein 14